MLFLLFSVNAAAQTVQIGEVGSQTTVSANWKTVTLSGTYTDPIVIAQARSYNGGDVGRARIRNVTSTSFQVKFKDFDFEQQNHNSQTMSYLVIERGAWVLPNGQKIEAGDVSLACCDTDSATSFAHVFGSTPALIATPNTDRDHSVYFRVKDLTASSFNMRFTDTDAAGDPETMNWVAMEVGGDGTYGLAELLTTTQGAIQTWTYGQTISATPHVFYTTRSYLDATPMTNRLNAAPNTTSSTFFQQINTNYVYHPVAEDVSAVVMPEGTIMGEQLPLIVTNTNDSGGGSLRAAIDYANANAAEDNITFAIPGAGPHMISPTSELPSITDEGVSIDASTQSGAACGQLTTGTPHTLRVQLDGTNAGADTEGIISTASGVTVKGLSLTNFSRHAIYTSSGGDNFKAECLYIGVAPDGTTKGANATSSSVSAAIRMLNVSNATLRNSLVSGNDDDTDDFGLRYNSVTGGAVEGNIFGLNAAGTGAIPNADAGIKLNGTTSSITIGGTTAQTRNLISGNSISGIQMDAVSNITVIGNYIGTDITGTAGLGNGFNGISLDGATNITIGDGTPAGRNIISNNGSYGVDITAVGTATLLGNYIGTDTSGGVVLSNGDVGVRVDGTGSTANIGDGTALGQNIIGGNLGSNILFDNNGSGDVNGNLIGIGPNGEVLSSVLSGVYLTDNGSAIIRNNTIAHNSPNGVGLTLTAGPTAIYSNSFFANVDLAIDLRDASGFGLTPNDAGDSDTGPNDLLNFPLINTISANGTTTVNYSVELDVPANTEGYRIEFFKNTSPDSTNGEGEVFLGFVDTGDHTGGAVSYDGSFTASEAVSVGDSISATTTRKTGATTYDITSEFAANVLAVSPLVVTNTNDSGTGSLRAAIEYANANAAEDNITFAIPGNASDVHTITPVTALPGITDAGISIDGTTQGDASCEQLSTGTQHTLRVMIDGNNANIVLFDVTAASVSIRGLSLGNARLGGVNFGTSADNGLVECNYFGVEADGVTDHDFAISSSSEAAVDIDGVDSVIVRNNVISRARGGIGENLRVDDGSTNTLITGNIIGLDASGTVSKGSSDAGIVVQTSSDTVIGGDTPEERNIIAASGEDNIRLRVGATNTTIIGNYIGTDITGLLDRGPVRHNIQSSSSSTNTIRIGGTASGEGNVIASAGNDQIAIADGGDNVTILGNYIGVGADGVTPMGAVDVGIAFGDVSTGNMVGNGTAEGANIIAYNGGDGVRVNNTGGQAAILGNLIFANNESGIDHNSSDGVTPNDVGDGDTGPNDLLNFPQINQISADGTTSVSYSIELDVPTNTGGYRIEFFKNNSPDSTNGEGEIFLGFVDTGDHTGGAISYDGSFTASEAVSVGDSISATATRKTGATSYDITSEFAANVLAVSPLVVTNTNDSGTGSLRDAITYANANNAEDNITFAIPGAGPHTITPLTALPDISDDNVSIDGTSQTGATCGNLWSGTPHNLLINIDGDGLTTYGLTTTASGVSFTGLAVGGFNGGLVAYPSASNTQFKCNYAGLNPDGTANGNVTTGIIPHGTNTLIGGPNATDGNVISSNGSVGISVGPNVANFSAIGNFIGTDPTGMLDRGNGTIGINQYFGGTATWGDIRDNLISGNGNDGIGLSDSTIISGSSGDVVFAGNYIGVDRTGNTALPNGVNGIDFPSGSISGATIGGTTEADRNVISGNSDDGISLTSVSNIDILGNYIGVGSDGVTDVGNSNRGILISSSSDIDIGDGTTLGRNIISGNNRRLIRLDNGGSNIAINDNYLGVDTTGNTYVNMSGGAQDAIAIAEGSYVNIDISNNVISGMPNEAIEVSVSGSIAGLIIQGNIIGFGKDESTVLPVGNASTGALEFRNNITVSGLKIGGDGVGEGNIIANSRGAGLFFNSNSGVSITGEILGNTIYDNTSDGVQINGNANKVAIYGNSIHDNGGLGIDFNNDGVSANDNDNTGPNETLNFPVINVFGGVGTTTVNYDINLDAPAADYRVDFYKNTTADPTGYGEGETHLGFIEFTHAGGNQNEIGSFTANVSVSANDSISATTTRKTGSSAYDITSEFSLSTVTASPAELTVDKQIAVYDPTGAGLYALPGNDVVSTLTVTNPGITSADTDSIFIVEAVPPEMSFYNGDIDGTGPQTNPVSFVQTGGANLSFTYATDVGYSNSGTRPSSMTACNYTPVAGYDPNVTFVCVNPKGAMASGDPDPTFSVAYRARIE